MEVHSMAKETLNAHWNTILPPDFQNVNFDWSVEKSESCANCRLRLGFA